MEDTAWERSLYEEEFNMSKIDWSKAPEDAQFYSGGHFRKYEQDEEFQWVDECTTWYETDYETLAEHRCYPDFQMRPTKQPTSLKELQQKVNAAIFGEKKINKTSIDSLEDANHVEVADLKDLIKDSPEQAWCGVMYKDGVPVDVTYDLGQPVGVLGQSSGAIKSDGGSSSYYDIQLPDWLMVKLLDRSYVGDVYIKTEELIEVMGDSFNQGTILKCLVRLNSLLNGAGKEGNNVDYECNKIIYYANRIKEESNR